MWIPSFESRVSQHNAIDQANRIPAALGTGQLAAAHFGVATTSPGV
jgi:hypothetical protein